MFFKLIPRLSNNPRKLCRYLCPCGGRAGDGGNGEAGICVDTYASLTARQAIVAFEHEAAKSKAQFNTHFRDMENLPLGEIPLLVMQSGFRREANGNFFLSLHNQQKQGISLSLTTDLLHLFCKLLEDATRQSDWAIPALVQEMSAHSAPLATHRLN